MPPVRDFCSDMSMRGEEPLPGSAIPAARMLFITWPKTSWAEQELDAQGFPESLRSYLKRAQRQLGVVPQLAHRSDLSPERHRLLLMPENVVVSGVDRSGIETVARALIEGRPLRAYESAQVGAPSLFVCTHGQRDRCCAKYGLALLRALEAERTRRQLRIELWECTHLGGDRFAANAFAFPWAHMYGRLRPEHASSLLEHAVSGSVYLPAYRGSMIYYGVRQLAEAVGQAERAARGLAAAVTFGAVVEHSESSADVEVNIGDASRLLVRCVRRQYEVTIDCRQLDAGRTRQVGRWTVERIDRLPVTTT